jgi:hypothetical protein
LTSDNHGVGGGTGGLRDTGIRWGTAVSLLRWVSLLRRIALLRWISLLGRVGLLRFVRIGSWLVALFRVLRFHFPCRVSKDATDVE